jgi:uncharacterized SAM-dependent methyltransferase
MVTSLTEFQSNVLLWTVDKTTRIGFQLLVGLYLRMTHILEKKLNDKITVKEKYNNNNNNNNNCALQQQGIKKEYTWKV